MATIYSKIDGKPMEVSDHVFSELTEFEASSKGHVLANFSSQPVEHFKTHVGMLRLGEFSAELADEERQKTAAERAEAERKKLEPPPQDPAKGADWADLVG
jgi:hypothetical protein